MAPIPRALPFNLKAAWRTPPKVEELPTDATLRAIYMPTGNTTIYGSVYIHYHNRLCSTHSQFSELVKLILSISNGRPSQAISLDMGVVD